MEYLDHHFEKPTTDYLRVMTAVPEIAVADPKANVEAILACYQEAKDMQAELLTLPELCVTGYSAADLFFNQHVLEQSDTAIRTLAEATADGPALVIGAPIADKGLLYNCGLLLADGQVQGVVPKSHLPNYNEFYEQRWFASGKNISDRTITVAGQTVPFGTDLLFTVNGTQVAIEVCEDAFAPISPGSYHALAGAEVIVNLSASDEVIGKPDYRRQLVAQHAAGLLCAYVYASAGPGESNADVVYGGHQLMNELGKPLAEVAPMQAAPTSLVRDIDRTYITHDRSKNTTFRDQANDIRSEQPYRTMPIEVPRPTDDELQRRVEPLRYTPRDKAELDARCEYMFDIMAHGLARAIIEGKTHSLVLGLSGGLDSTLALLTALQTCQIVGRGTDFIHTLTMPGMASSERTQDNASLLAGALGTTHRETAIQDLAQDALAAIGHDQVTEDITYENTQARMRTLLLMNYANKFGGMVVGTGDLSEAAQGWCTFNGDHISMYNPNNGIPKTLVRHLVRWYADNRADAAAQAVLNDILDTPVSPELTGNGDLSQTTEDIIGPYELLDFFMNEAQRYGSRPEKIGYLAAKAFAETYNEPTINHWLQSYLARFTASQWKREVAANGPKVGISFSPRGDWRMAPNTSPDWYK